MLAQASLSWRSFIFTYILHTLHKHLAFVMGVDDQAISYTRGGTTSVSVYHCTELNEYLKDGWMIDEEMQV